MKIYQMAISAVLACSLLAVPAQAQGQRDQSESPRSRSTDHRQMIEDTQREGVDRPARRQPRAARGHISGTVARTKLVDVRGTQDRHLVVLLKTERGNRVPVDLGPTQGLSETEIRSEQDTTAYGSLIRIGQKQVLIAEEMRIGDQRVRIPQRRPVQRWKGRIESTKMIQLPGVEQKTLMARVRTNEGEIVFAVLGDQQRIQGVDLRSGDQVDFAGRSLSIRDRKIVIAQKLNADGQTLATLQQGRPDKRQRESTSQRSTQQQRSARQQRPAPARR